MEKISVLTFTSAARIYLSLTKPGIILGNIITASAGFALASKGNINFLLFLATLFGLSLVIASACIFNNYIDREIDRKMTRTKDHALAQGLISSRNAIILAIVLGVFGIFFLMIFTNFLTVMAALFGFFGYVILYSFFKYRSSHGTLIGSFAGAVPPVVGYCSVSNQFDLGALILFIMIVLWQMPHFFAIAIYRIEDYAAANLPVLPIKKDIYTTKIQMLFYIVAFIAVSLLLWVFQYTGFAYLIIAAVLGLTWLVLCIQGFKDNSEKLWARKMFFFSLIIVLGLCLVIPFSVI